MDEKDNEGVSGNDARGGQEAQNSGMEAQAGNESMPTNDVQHDAEDVGGNIDEQDNYEVDDQVVVDEGDLAKNLEDTLYEGNVFDSMNAIDEDVGVEDDNVAREAGDNEKSILNDACHAPRSSPSKEITGRKKIKLVSM